MFAIDAIASRQPAQKYSQPQQPGQRKQANCQRLLLCLEILNLYFHSSHSSHLNLLLSAIVDAVMPIKQLAERVQKHP